MCQSPSGIYEAPGNPGRVVVLATEKIIALAGPEYHNAQTYQPRCNYLETML